MPGKETNWISEVIKLANKINLSLYRGVLLAGKLEMLLVCFLLSASSILGLSAQVSSPGGAESGVDDKAAQDYLGLG